MRASVKAQRQYAQYREETPHATRSTVLVEPAQAGWRPMNQKQFQPSPATSMKLYLYKGSRLIGESVSAIRKNFHLRVEVLEDQARGSADRLKEGTEVRLSGDLESVSAFLGKYL